MRNIKKAEDFHHSAQEVGRREHPEGEPDVAPHLQGGTSNYQGVSCTVPYSPLPVSALGLNDFNGPDPEPDFSDDPAGVRLDEIIR